MEDSSEDDRKPSAVDPHNEPATKIPRDSDATSKSRTVKPALKKTEKPASSREKQRHLKWDEAAIEEHDQLRGTRMKIDEPNTPYTHYDSGAESDDSRRPKSPAVQKDSISWDTLQTRLDSVAAVQDAYPSSPSSHAGTDHSDVEDERKREMRRLEFREHRKRHYNEMELVKKFRAEHPDGLLENENGEGDADDENE